MLSLSERDVGPALEMLAIQSMIRNMEMRLPKNLGGLNKWNLLAYQTPRLISENWLLQNKVFTVDESNIFGSNVYHAHSDKLIAAS